MYNITSTFTVLPSALFIILGHISVCLHKYFSIKCPSNMLREYLRLYNLSKSKFSTPITQGTLCKIIIYILSFKRTYNSVLILIILTNISSSQQRNSSATPGYNAAVPTFWVMKSNEMWRWNISSNDDCYSLNRIPLHWHNYNRPFLIVVAWSK
jgi:hypothetical protein